MGKEVARPGLRKRQMSGADTAEYQDRKTFKLDPQAQNNRVPVIKISQSSPLPCLNGFQKILPPPMTLISVSRLQSIKKVDPSNNIEKIVIKKEPEERRTPCRHPQPSHS